MSINQKDLFTFLGNNQAKLSIKDNRFHIEFPTSYVNFNMDDFDGSFEPCIMALMMSQIVFANEALYGYYDDKLRATVLHTDSSKNDPILFGCMGVIGNWKDDSPNELYQICKHADMEYLVPIKSCTVKL